MGEDGKGEQRERNANQGNVGDDNSCGCVEMKEKKGK